VITLEELTALQDLIQLSFLSHTTAFIGRMPPPEVFGGNHGKVVARISGNRDSGALAECGFARIDCGVLGTVMPRAGFVVARARDEPVALKGIRSGPRASWSEESPEGGSGLPLTR
jgi:hypothetical protein